VPLAGIFKLAVHRQKNEVVGKKGQSVIVRMGQV
jgi:hypothetical protein